MNKLIPLAIFITLTPLTIHAQVSSSGLSALASPVAIGNGLQAPLRFSNEAVPTNQVSVSMGASMIYNDNVFDENSDRVADEAASITSHFAFLRQTRNVSFNFNYSPSFFLYKNTTQYDRLNHMGNLDLEYRFSPRWVLTLDDGISYQNGIFQSLVGQQISSGLGSPTGLNQSVFPYTDRTLTNTSGFDLIFVKSHRTSIALTGGYNVLQFGSSQIAGEPLYNGRSASGGIQYQYHITEHTSFGISVLHEDSTYKGGDAIGSLERYQTESALIALQSHFTPSVTVSFFGGPQYITTFGESAGVSATEHFQGAGGGSITKEVRKTAFDITLERRVSDSGGIYGQVEYTSATLGVRRHLVGHWEADFRNGATRIDTLYSQLGTGRTDGLLGSFELVRPFANGATFRVSYQNGHQLSSGTLPIAEKYDLNLVTLAIDFRLKSIPIGH